jgi:prephenate dehydrogenase
MKITIVGLGLIGGSIAKDLNSQINVEVLGVDVNEAHCKEAMELNLVSKIITLDEALIISDVIIFAIPVDVLENILPEMLDKISTNQVLIDVGSTKLLISEAVFEHPKRGRFVAAHPLAGTEFSGPQAAMRGLFSGKKNIVCDRGLSDDDALTKAVKIFESIGLVQMYMDSSEHDKHMAYVSHLSHVTSFMLGLTVLDIERDEKQIFNLAGTGFASTVRLAKSNPNTWSPIFMKNKKNISTALEQYISWLQKFKLALDQEDTETLKSYMVAANDIKRVLNN